MDREAFTTALGALTRGQRDATALLPEVYSQLRKLAAHYLAGEKDCGLLQPTALVHEAYLRLVQIDKITWQDIAHFRAMAARMMRRVLVEHARAAGASKRDPGGRLMTIDEGVIGQAGSPVEFLALEQALTKLSKLNPRQAKVAEQRIFAGLAVKESALLLGVSERTVKQDWRFARAWLIRQLELRDPPGKP